MQMMLTSSTFSEQFGQGFMFAGTHHKTEQPVALIRFSLDDGSQEAFFHKGYINKLFSRDVDGDGRNELLMTGYNNLLENMVVIVLDPDHIGGASPRGACYNISDNNVDIAKYYIRLPKYHRFVEFPSRYYPLHPNIIDDSGELRLIVKSRTEAIVYTIAEGMSFINAEVFMTHKSSSGQRDSLSSVEFTETEKEEDEKGLLEGVRFWDGENWVAEPVVNRSYLKHVREGD